MCNGLKIAVDLLVRLWRNDDAFQYTSKIGIPWNTFIINHSDSSGGSRSVWLHLWFALLIQWFIILCWWRDSVMSVIFVPIFGLLFHCFVFRFIKLPFSPMWVRWPFVLDLQGQYCFSGHLSWWVVRCNQCTFLKQICWANKEIQLDFIKFKIHLWKNSNL